MNARLKELIEVALTEIEDVIIENSARANEPVNFSPDAFRASLMIFQTVMLERMWELQKSEGMEMTDREIMAFELGKELGKLIHVFTGIDTHQLY